MHVGDSSDERSAESLQVRDEIRVFQHGREAFCGVNFHPRRAEAHVPVGDLRAHLAEPLNEPGKFPLKLGTRCAQSKKWKSAKTIVGHLS